MSSDGEYEDVSENEKTVRNEDSTDEDFYCCRYGVFWSEKTKQEAQKTTTSTSFALGYLMKIHELLSVPRNVVSYPWAIGRFNLRIDPASSDWSNVSLVGEYHALSLTNEAQIWLIVINALLYISQYLPELVIKVEDSVYQNYLLTVCASSIPSWIKNDDVAANRVFISNGGFHFIPRELLTSKKPVLLEDAVAAVSSPMTITAMDLDMCNRLAFLMEQQASEIKRILDEGIRYYQLILPESLAMALRKRPVLIPIICEAYYPHYFLTIGEKKVAKATRMLCSKSPTKTLVPLTKRCYALISDSDIPFSAELGQNELGMRLVMGFISLVYFLQTHSSSHLKTGIGYNSHEINEAKIFARRELELGQEISSKELEDMQLPFATTLEAIEEAVSADLSEPPAHDFSSKKWNLSEEEASFLINGLNTLDDDHDQEPFSDFGLSSEGSAGSSGTEDEDSSSGLDYGSEYDEFEVLDTLSNDPELLMRVIEKCSKIGEPSNLILEKLAKLAIDRKDKNVKEERKQTSSESETSSESSDEDISWM